MARKILLAFLCVPMLALTGCGSAYKDQGWAPPRPLGAQGSGQRAPTTLPVSSRRLGFSEPQGVITLRQALSAALVQSPELASFAYGVRSAEADVLQASLLPNPELGLEVENFGGSKSVKKFDAAESTVSLSQLIELGGKRSKRTRAAQLATGLAGWDYETKRMDVLTDVARRFVDVAAAQRRLELAQQNVDLSDKVLSTVTERVQAGKVSPVEQTKARVLLLAGRAALGKTRGQLASARQQLAATWGSPKAQFESVNADLETLAPVPAKEALFARVAQNPDLARWTTELNRRRADIAVAKSRSIPDLTVAAGARRFSEDGDVGAVMGVSIPIPIFNQNQGEIRKSRMEMLKALADQRAAQTRIFSALEVAYQDLSTAHNTAIVLRDEVLPGAESAFSITNISYTEGKLPYIEVLDAQRTLYEARGQYTDALIEYHKAVADVERLIGERLVGQGVDTIVETQASTKEAATQKSQEK